MQWSYGGSVRRERCEGSKEEGSKAENKDDGHMMALCSEMDLRVRDVVVPDLKLTLRDSRCSGVTM